MLAVKPGEREDRLQEPRDFDHLDRIQGLSSSALAPQARKIQLTQDAGIVLDVHVKCYEKQPGDRVAYSWDDKNGQKQELKMLEYYICDIGDVELRLKD